MQAEAIQVAIDAKASPFKQRPQVDQAERSKTAHRMSSMLGLSEWRSTRQGVTALGDVEGRYKVLSCHCPCLPTFTGWKSAQIWIQED